MCTYLYTDFCQSGVSSFRGQQEGSTTFLELLGGLAGGNRPQKLEKALRGRDAVLADGVRQVYTEEVKMRGLDGAQQCVPEVAPGSQPVEEEVFPS